MIATYYYDPFGLRLYKDVGGIRTYFLYNGEGLAAEYDASGNLIAEYHYGPNKPWMTDPLFQRRDGNVYYYQTDHLGTPQKLITKSGQVVWQGQYEAFGKVTETINTIDNPLRFPGQYADDETGTYYNTYRDYDSGLGRYIQRDPLGLGGGTNPFGYVLQNPVRHSDPTGQALPLAIVGTCAVAPQACAAAAALAAGAVAYVALNVAQQVNDGSSEELPRNGQVPGTIEHRGEISTPITPKIQGPDEGCIEEAETRYDRCVAACQTRAEEDRCSIQLMADILGCMGRENQPPELPDQDGPYWDDLDGGAF
ncbi:MAG: RHS repeat-associated core domain-containing protein [Gammaproteobacteria bacterium]|nr:RHS repeat-associated core domain-containing protein [Gammaproteobacteria bacterium]